MGIGWSFWNAHHEKGVVPSSTTPKRRMRYNVRMRVYVLKHQSMDVTDRE